MTKISQKQINDAAKSHASEVLGTQSKSNPEASKAIHDDFKAGVKWYLKSIKQG